MSNAAPGVHNYDALAFCVFWGRHVRRIYAPAIGEAQRTSEEWGWDGLWPRTRTIAVHEGDTTSLYSGLLDADGRKLMVKVERDPIGFVRFPIAD